MPESSNPPYCHIQRRDCTLRTSLRMKGQIRMQGQNRKTFENHKKVLAFLETIC